MDIKRFLTTMLMTGAIMLAVYYIFPGVFGNGNKAPTVYPTTSYAPLAAAQPAASQQGATPTLITLGSAAKGAPDKLALTVNNVTAAVEKVELNIAQYAETIARAKPLTLLEAHPNLPKPFATTGVHVTLMPSGREIDLRPTPGIARTPEQIRADNATALLKLNYIWKITRQTATEVDLLCSIFDGPTTPVADITKSYKIDPASYEVIVDHHVKNLTASPIKVEIVQLGASDLPRDNIQMDNRFYHAAKYNTAKQIVDGGAGTWLGTGGIAVDLPHPNLQNLTTGTINVGTAVGNDPIVWVGASNRFFAAIMRPLPRPGTPMLPLASGRTIPAVDHIADIHVDILFHDDKDPSKTITTTRFEGARIEIPAAGSTNLPISAYFGPKKRDILDGSVSAAPGTLDWSYYTYDYIKMIRFSQGGPCGPCTFDWLAIFILKFLDVLVHYVAFGNYGVAIIILVIIVRLLLHPLTRASQVQMAVMSKKMQAIAPEIEAAKKRYAKDKQKQQQELMRIYKEHNVNPAGGIMGCLPMLLQMPIWMALYAGLAVDIDLRHASFIPGWINDLSNPDAIYSWTPFNVPIMGPIGSLNLLPLLLGVVFYFQMKVMSANQPKATDPQQAQMQKISQYMIFLFPLFLYSAPSGLNVYIFASTIGGLFDTYLVRRTLRAKGILPPTAGALTNGDEEDNKKIVKPN